MNRSISAVKWAALTVGLLLLGATSAGSRIVPVAFELLVLLACSALFGNVRLPPRSIARGRATPAGFHNGKSRFELDRRTIGGASVRNRRIVGRDRLEWIVRVTSSSDGNRRNRRDADGDRDETNARSDHVRSPSELTRAEARAILDVGLTADDAEIKAAYRRRIKDVHPDNGGDRAEFLRVKAAYERLID